MNLYPRITRDVDAGPKGAHVAALFDFDGTLIAGFSVFAFFREQLRRRELSRNQLSRIGLAAAGYGAGNLGFSGLLVASAKMLEGMSEADMNAMAADVFARRIAKIIYPEARALIQAHQRMGHTVAIVSSATRFQVEPAAKTLGVEHLLCSELIVEDGCFTGDIVRPTCFGEGKVTAAEQLAESLSLDLDQSYFYSDSHDDLPLLERVGRARPLNPNNKLVDIAEQRRWPIRRFASRGRPRVSDLARTAGAVGSMIPSFLSGLPIWALTGSRSEGQNFSMSVFADVASAFIGLNLDINGEHHLWQHRPAVFIFNHQSQADVVIVAKLLRRDVAGVGKKEIASVPILGQIMQMTGTVMIDRSNAHKAVESMRRLVNTIQVEGKSIAIAPEGTRTVSTQLGPFKKGAFHLAMQAGVPIVPIVIRNAMDVSPKGDFLFHAATVGVEVLAPIDTSAWRAATMEQHVADVRKQYLDTLGQGE
ncbi:MAG: HAD-IB family hydrolase [Pseudomonadota bacterium]